MATYIETIKSPGQGSFGTLDGSVTIEQTSARISIRQDSQEGTRLDIGGLKVYDLDNNGKEIVRAGKFPGNNGHGLAVAEEGESIEEAIT